MFVLLRLLTSQDVPGEKSIDFDYPCSRGAAGRLQDVQVEVWCEGLSDSNYDLLSAKLLRCLQ